MDSFTKIHLLTWASTVLHSDERADKVALMESLYNTDPDYWADRGWSAVLRAVESN